MEHSINSKLIELLKLKLKYNQSTGIPSNDPESEECISSWVTDMMKDKTSLWFDSIRYAEIRNDYNHVKSSYISYTEDRTLAQYNQEDTSPRKFSENSDNKSNDGLLRKNSDVSQYTDHSNMTLKTENLVKTSNLNHEPTPMFKVLSEISETPSMASFHPQKSQFQRKRGETQHLVKKIRQPNGEETEIHAQHFGKEESKGSSDDGGLPTLGMAKKISSPEIDYKDTESVYSRTIEKSSMTASTTVSCKDDRLVSIELKVVDCLLSNVFTKLSDFSDALGRKMVFKVDWDYMKRHWKFSHAYMKDMLLETMFAYSLMDEFISEQNNEFRATDNPYQFKDDINKMLVSNYAGNTSEKVYLQSSKDEQNMLQTRYGSKDYNNILYHLMSETFGIEEPENVDSPIHDNNDNSDDLNLSPRKNENSDLGSQNWQLSSNIEKIIETSFAYE